MDPDKYKELQLLRFAWEGKLLEVHSLLSEGVNLNVKTCDGKTPLMLAAQNGHADVVKLLIDSRSVINCCDVEKGTVLHYASKRNWVCIDLDAQSARGETAMMLAVKSRKYHVVLLLIDAGANINCLDINNWSVLHHAALNGCKQIVEAFLDKGADINAVDLVGHTPLHLYINFARDIETMYYLLNSGANFNLANNLGVSPFSLLIENQLVGGIRLCIEKGAYLTSYDYGRILGDPYLRSCVLNRQKCCMLAIINKFNNNDLPALYKFIGSPNILPKIDKLKIKNNSGTAKEIAKAVAEEINKKSFCNIIKMQPLVLSMLCVRSFLENARSVESTRALLNRIKPSSLHSGKRRQKAVENTAKRMCLQMDMGGLYDRLLAFLSS